MSLDSIIVISIFRTLLNIKLQLKTMKLTTVSLSSVILQLLCT